MTLEPSMKAGSKLRRRGFLSILGGTGLGAAAAVFGGATAAEATVSFGCCNLAFANSGNVTYCISKSHYVWSCNNGGQNYCNCCEVKNSSGNFIRSDANCREGG